MIWSSGRQGVARVRKVWWGLWWLCLAFVIVVGVGFVREASSLASSSDDPPGTVSEAGCDEALEFAGASLPAGASAAKCTSYTWGGQAYDGSFRMPRSAVTEWLATSFPTAEHPASCAAYGEEDVDVCAFVRNDPDDGHTTGAYDVDVSVHYEGGPAGDTALVTFEASTY
ncbi:hypothetical protein ACWCQK_05645 [Streptomyces sp. NPDC002306]